MQSEELNEGVEKQDQGGQSQVELAEKKKENQLAFHFFWGNLKSINLQVVVNNYIFSRVSRGFDALFWKRWISRTSITFFNPTTHILKRKGDYATKIITPYQVSYEADPLLYGGFREPDRQPVQNEDDGEHQVFVRL